MIAGQPRRCSRPMSGTPAANEDAILDLELLQHPDLLLRRRRRPHFPDRHRRPALPAAAPAADRLRADAVRVRLADLRHRRRSDGDEIHRLDRPARFGFRRTLVVNALISGAFMAAYALFTPSTPHWLIFLALLSGGFFRSLEFTALNAISYADIDPPRMSRATSFASVSQQMSGALGVAVAAVCIQIIQVGFGDKTLFARDLSTAFVLVAVVSSLSTLVFTAAEAGRRRGARGQGAGARGRRGRARGIACAASNQGGAVRTPSSARRRSPPVERAKDGPAPTREATHFSPYSVHFRVSVAVL